MGKATNTSTMYQQPMQPQYQQPMQTQQNQSYVVIYPQGIAWRSAPNYNARITNIAGPAANTVLSGPVIMGQDGLQYLQVGQQFVPMSSPQGQQLMAPAMQQDIQRVQQTYVQQQPGYAQPGMMHGGCHGGKHNKKMYKKQKCHKKHKGYKIKLF